MTKPRVFYFNPTCELAIANGSFSYMAPLLLQEMETDLSHLPFIFCSPNDIVLTENPPSPDFKSMLEYYGLLMPSFYKLKDLESFPKNSFEAITPWGWSPASHYKFQNLKQKCIHSFTQSPVFEWKNEHRLLFERSTSLEFVKAIISKDSPEWFVDEKMLGSKVVRCEEIEILLKNHGALVLKAPLSSSGRGIQIIRKNTLNKPNKQWIEGLLKQQNYLIAEPFLDKILDLSFQFNIDSNSEIEYLGHSVFETNSNGQYKGTHIRPNLSFLIKNEDIGELVKKIKETAKILREALNNSIFTSLHRGYIGIDALLFMKEGQIRIQPCLEINSRLNMGILSLFLENKIHHLATGKFSLFYGKVSEYRKFTEVQTNLFPSKLKDGKLLSGFLSLSEPATQCKFGAYVSLEEAK